MNTYRPDEIASKSNIENSRNIDRNVKTGIKAAGSLALAATGAGLSARILPFLNEAIPIDLAIKGISKLSPKMGDMLNKGMKQGLSAKDGLNFIKENLMSKPKKEQEQNIISQHSQELYQALKDKIGQGIQPLAAAYQFANDSKYKKDVADIQKKTGKNFSDLVSAVFGGGENEQAAPQAQQQAQQAQPGQQSGQGQQALMAMIQKINQKLGG